MTTFSPPVARLAVAVSAKDVLLDMVLELDDILGNMERLGCKCRSLGAIEEIDGEGVFICPIHSNVAAARKLLDKLYGSRLSELIGLQCP